MASTCDQASTNVSAINQLIDPTKKRSKSATGHLLSYKIGDRDIIHCYDPPHLLKGIRNNLITKKLIHHITKRWNLDSSTHKIRCKASWEHLRRSYEHSFLTNTKLPNITAEHLEPKKSKMRVDLAAQIFSQTFGNMILKYASKGELPKRFTDTAEVLLFFNDVFDSVNGSRSCPSEKNQLKAAVKDNSIHFSFWSYALCMLSRMAFLDPRTGQPTRKTSVLQHFQSTIRGYIELCKKCFNLNVTDISLR